ncbi:MAG TPA: hypothetical protein VIO32_10265 [Candidatus Baltobacteraceae bacterium]
MILMYTVVIDGYEPAIVLVLREICILYHDHSTGPRAITETQDSSSSKGPADTRAKAHVMQLLALSSLVDAAVLILSDGKARTAGEILEEGQKSGLFGASTTRQNLSLSLLGYIERALATGRKPQILKDDQHHFYINRTPDDWPDVDITGLPPLASPPALNAQAQDAITRARHEGADPTEYEKVVCGLFSCLGFAATHVGGVGAPDGYADALLGPLAYRVMIECKLESRGTIGETHGAPEAAKYNDSYHGTYCALVAPQYPHDLTFVSELKVHGVSAWTTDDLIRVLEHGISAFDLRAVFVAPGIVSDAIDDLLWDRVHGEAKRLRVVASLIMQQMLAQQSLYDQFAQQDEAPVFTIDVAMAAVDAALAQHGSVRACSREEARAAFEWMTNPLVRVAVWTDETKSAIVRT